MPTNNSSLLEKHAANYAAFRVQDTLVEILPSLHLPRLPLLSNTPMGPLKAGLAQSVPLWMALVLQQRSLCTIACPAWLTVDNLVEILQYEKTQATLWPHAARLPYFYVQLAQALLQTANSNNSNPKVSLESDETAAVLGLLIQDLVQVRLDKLRQQFQQLLAEEPHPSDDDHNNSALEKPNTVDWVVSINGMGAHEAAVLQPFVQQALADWRYLHQGSPPAASTTAAAATNSNNNNKAASHEEATPAPLQTLRRVPIRRHR